MRPVLGLVFLVFIAFSGCVAVGNTRTYVRDPLFPSNYRIYDRRGNYVGTLKPDVLNSSVYIERKY